MKKIFIAIFVLLVFVVMPVSASQQADLVRVGITDNNFQNVLKQEAVLYATSDAEICDKYSRRSLIKVSPNENIVIKNSISGLNVTVGEQNATLRDFVIVSPAGLIGIKDLTRKGLPAVYHGAFEVVQNNVKNADSYL